MLWFITSSLIPAYSQNTLKGRTQLNEETKTFENTVEIHLFKSTHRTAAKIDSRG